MARSFHVTVQPLQDIFKSQQYPVSNSCRFKPSTGVPTLGGSQVGFTSDKFKGLAMQKGSLTCCLFEVLPHIGTSSQAVQCPPLMKVKDGFQHDENHANCRSKGKITLWTILMERSQRFTMKFWEGSTWHRFQNSSWQSSLRYYPINSRSPELQQPSPAGND